MSLYVPSGSGTNVSHSIFRACLSSSSDSGIEKALTPAGHVATLNLLTLLHKALVPLPCAYPSVGEFEELGHNPSQVLEHRHLQIRAQGFPHDFLGFLVRRLLRGFSVPRFLSPRSFSQ